MEKNKSNITIGIILAILLSLACKNLTDCEKIRNGAFYYYAKRTREKINIHRTDSMQIETDDKTGSLISRSKVVWKADCKYDMFLNAFSNVKLTGDDSIIAVTPAHVDVIAIRDSFYICTVKLNVFDKEIQLRDTMYFSRSPN